jgi:hypothetical protein
MAADDGQHIHAIPRRSQLVTHCRVMAEPSKSVARRALRAEIILIPLLRSGRPIVHRTSNTIVCASCELEPSV